MMRMTDMMLSDVLHAERLHQAEQALLVREALAGAKRPNNQPWWWPLGRRSTRQARAAGQPLVRAPRSAC